MPMKALFVDLPNFYSRFLSTGIDEPRILRDYFIDWFDFDRLAQKLTGEFCSVWVFYSGGRIGPSTYRIDGSHLKDFIDRINRLRGITAHDVNIPGKQREPTTYKCDKCGFEGEGQWESEKGIDASLTVHLFDTIDSWDTAYLLSGDADFVPTVASLRRRGKIVVGAGFSTASPALVRECYEYIDVDNLFLKEDIAAFRIFSKDGIAQKWLLDEVNSDGSNDFQNELIKFSFEWQNIPGRIGIYHLASISEISDENSHYSLYFIVSGPANMIQRKMLLDELMQKYPEQKMTVRGTNDRYHCVISPLAWKGISRRLDAFESGLKISARLYDARNNGVGYEVEYEYDTESKKYKLTTNF